MSQVRIDGDDVLMGKDFLSKVATLFTHATTIPKQLLPVAQALMPATDAGPVVLPKSSLPSWVPLAAGGVLLAGLAFVVLRR